MEIKNNFYDITSRIISCQDIIATTDTTISKELKIEDKRTKVENRLKNAIHYNDKVIMERTARICEIRDLRKQAEKIEASYVSLACKLKLKTQDYKKMEQILENCMNEVSRIHDNISKHCHYNSIKYPKNTKTDCIICNENKHIEGDTDADGFLIPKIIVHKKLTNEMKTLRIVDADSQSSDLSDEHSDVRSDSQSNVCSDGRLDDQSNVRPDGRFDDQSDVQSDVRSDSLSDGRSKDLRSSTSDSIPERLKKYIKFDRSMFLKLLDNVATFCLENSL